MCVNQQYYHCELQELEYQGKLIHCLYQAFMLDASRVYDHNLQKIEMGSLFANVFFKKTGMTHRTQWKPDGLRHKREEFVSIDQTENTCQL